MEIKPVDSGMQKTPIRMPDRLEVKEDGSVQITADKVEIKKKAPKPQKSALEKALTGGAKTILTGVGFGSGLVGGGIIGAGVGASGGLLQGLMNSSITWAGVSGAGLIGGIVGAALFGVAGAYGGWAFSSVLIKSGKFLTKLLFTKEPLSEEQQASLDRIKQVEDNPKEASKAVKYLSSTLAADEKLEDETELYVGFLNHFGNKKSEAALSAYATVKKFLPPGAGRGEAVAELGKFAGTFKTPEEAMDALYLVMNNLKAKDSLSGEAQKYRDAADYLKKCAPDYAVVSPEVAGYAYLAFKNSFVPDEQNGAMDAILGQISQTKMQPDEVMNNCIVVIKNRRKGEDLQAEASCLMEYLSRVEGDNGRKLYLDAKKALAPGQERLQALSEFDEFKRVFGNQKDAEDALGRVLRNFNTNDTMIDESKRFRKTAEYLGACTDNGAVTSQTAGDVYMIFKAKFAPEERDKAMKDTIGQFKKISQNEVLENLKIIVGNRNNGDDLAAETANLMALTEKLGDGRAARDFYVTAKTFLPPGEDRSKAITEYDTFGKTFPQPDQAMGALCVVLKNLNKSDSMSAECESLRKTADYLKACASDNTAISSQMAGEVYLTVKKNCAPEDRDKTMQSIFGSIAALKKSSPEDVMESFKVLMANRRTGEDLGADTKGLYALANDLGGEMKTARNAFAFLKKGFTAEKRDEARGYLLQLQTLEKSPDKALDAFAQIFGSMYKGENLGDNIKEYTNLYTLFSSGTDAHASALKAYKMTMKNFETGAGRQAALEGLTKLREAHGSSPNNVLPDFEFVYSHTSKGETFSQEMDKYLGYLKSAGSSSAAQSAYLQSKFKELYH